jgi:hypothetical protein
MKRERCVDKKVVIANVDARNQAKPVRQNQEIAARLS